MVNEDRPRISLTFRWLASHPTEQNQPTPIPPVTEPRSDRPKRVLFLTASVHGGTPEHIFESIPNHICIKQKEYQLTNIDKYSDQFEYTDVVVVSMGINDLSRYGHSAQSLANSITRSLQSYSVKYPNCVFIFNSLLLTRDYQRLNDEVELFNRMMFDFTRNSRNVSFFDSHHFSMNLEVPSFYIQGQKGSINEQSMRNGQSNNGIHVSLQLRCGG